jgi:hypothetical protein
MAGSTYALQSPPATQLARPPACSRNPGLGRSDTAGWSAARLRPSQVPARPARSGIGSTVSARPTVVQRCGGQSCPPGTCDHSDERKISRSASTIGPDFAPPIVSEALASPGNSLAPSVRAEMETRFGRDFGHVRVHTDAQAAQAAHAINARAYTSGHDVVFAVDQFSPGSSSGKRLLAHELAHVVQQSVGSVRPGISRPGDVSEREADRLASSATEAGPLERGGGRSGSEMADGMRPTVGAADRAVQRWPGDGMVPPGDCSWATYLLLRGAVEAAKAVVDLLGACTALDNCAVLLSKIAAVSTEIAARVALDTTCFKGGDTGHRQQVQDKIGMLNRCYQFFADKDCLAVLAAAAAAAAAAVNQAAADGATAVEAGDAAAATGELIEGAAATGEVVEGGVTLMEVLEGIALVVAL